MFVKAVSLPFRLRVPIDETDALECDVVLDSKTTVRIIRQTYFEARLEIVFEVQSREDFDAFVQENAKNRAWSPLSDDFSKFADAHADDASRRMDTILNGLRWRFSAAGVLSATVARVHFSVDGVEWPRLNPPMPGAASFEIVSSPARQKVGDIFVKAIQESLGDLMPLSRELYLEARELSSHNPRSAVVMLVAAAEVGLKEFISSAAPHTKWLMANLPSPPLKRLIDDYLPTLPAKLVSGGKAIAPPKHIRRALHQANEYRNRVVHKGEAIPSQEVIAEYLDAVSDFLYLLDVFGGHEWALKVVSNETLIAIREETKQRRDLKK